MSHTESKRNLEALARVPIQLNDSPFMKLRIRCDAVGLVLERAKRGYFLSGLDLPAAGLCLRNREEVLDELMNYE